MSSEELRDLVRQLRAELLWAQRTGIAPAAALSAEAREPKGDSVERPAQAPPPPALARPAPAPAPARPAPARPAPAPARPAPAPVERLDPEGEAALDALAHVSNRPGAVAALAASSRSTDDGEPPPIVDEASLAFPFAPKPLAHVTPAGLAIVKPTLAEVRAELGDCTRCKLARQGRKQIVFGVGNPDAELMFVGEAPGADEDQRGEPFVGKAGQLLTRIIEAMGFQRSEVYIANVIKCRPPQNRDPELDEVESCEPFLKRQIAAVAPKIIVTLGKHAAHAVLKNSIPITRQRGRWGRYEGIPVMPTYHPAYLLRNPAEKRPVWEDMKAVLAAMGKKVPERGGSEE
jgi:DNA polymerase